MQITLENIGKKYHTEWIFTKVNFTFEENSSTAILGCNGSGKSTLLQIVAGNLHPTSGTVQYYHEGRAVPDAAVFRYLSIVAPYQELIEEFTLREMMEFHFSFKRYLPGYDLGKAVSLLGFRVGKQKQIRQFSSGMKQRLKLVLAMLSDVPVLLLDEPTMNLDSDGIRWYHDLVGETGKNRNIIVCSNQFQTECPFTKATLSIEQFK